ncbi:MAG: flagellar hook-associated protein FlgK [Candidatus Melainabacteria bacterium RIFOXYA2_FULL_32_9]|nr:MAG: flagellar hook-associated protein FlgK [Candidatus Melainabacteria bacterium RIFOXYA2_FULL_32_9]
MSLFGIFNSHRSILLNQAAINLINNNIANINTPGYSKQRLELSQQVTVDSGVNTTISRTQSGAGAVIDNITRNRDAYLDAYFRKETTGLSFYKELNETASLMEDITNELGDTGINQALNEFYNTAHELSINPNDSIIRNNLVQKAKDLCNKFNLTYDRLDDLRSNLVGDATNPATLSTSKIALDVNDLNVKLSALANINKTICDSSSQGAPPNGLLDQRDILLDQIAEYIPITVTQGSNSLVTVSLNGVDLVKNKEQVGFFNVATGTTSDPATLRILDEDNNIVVANANSSITSGKIGAILEMGGSDSSKLNIYNVLTELNTLAREFSREINTIHQGGQYIDTSVSPNQLALVSAAPFDIFVEQDGVDTATYADLTAGNIKVNQDIIDDVFKIAAAGATSAVNETGDGSNALVMAEFRNTKIAALNSSSTESYLNAVVGNLGIQVKSVQDNYESQDTIVQQISSKRESTIGVNLDEELADLIRFQRSFEASAKVLTVVNEAMQRIINLAG